MNVESRSPQRYASKSTPSRAAVAAVISVTMKPGATALAVIPNGSCGSAITPSLSPPVASQCAMAALYAAAPCAAEIPAGVLLSPAIFALADAVATLSMDQNPLTTPCHRPVFSEGGLNRR